MAAAAPTEMENSFVFLLDLKGEEIYQDEIKIKVEDDKTLVIRYNCVVSHNGTLLVSVNKIIQPNTERTIKVVNGEAQLGKLVKFMDISR
ncbi:hypothetical protein MKX01_035357 [Papaver californicum]|nr:hypothetical protein MKX01_035357 [Papaver californicum]